MDDKGKGNGGDLWTDGRYKFSLIRLFFSCFQKWKRKILQHEENM